MSASKSNVVKYVTLAVVLVVVALSWLRPISNAADAYVDEGLKRSLISFASARALNGVISVLQGTQVAVSPLGFGVSLTVGEALDPINDLVEAFSSVMLMASVAFGVQKLLLAIGSNWAVSATLTLIALAWAFLFWKDRSPQWLFRLVGILLFIRFVMPVATIGSAMMFNNFASAKYSESQTALDTTTKDLQALAPSARVATDQDDRPSQPAANPAEAEKAASEESSKPSFIQRMWQGTKDAATGTVATIKEVVKDPSETFRRKYEGIKQAAETAVERMITLIGIFLMQTVIVPMLLLFGLYWLCRDLFRLQPGATSSPLQP